MFIPVQVLKKNVLIVINNQRKLLASLIDNILNEVYFSDVSKMANGVNVNS